LGHQVPELAEALGRGRVQRLGCWCYAVSESASAAITLAGVGDAGPLGRLETACRLLAETHVLDEVRSIRDIAEAARVYACEVHLGLEAQNDAAEIKIRAERRLGELLASTQLQNGGDAARARSHEATELRPRLRDFGISKTQSSRWQALAAFLSPYSTTTLRALAKRADATGRPSSQQPVH
jgi:hypothetical protein